MKGEIAEGTSRGTAEPAWTRPSLLIFRLALDALCIAFVIALTLFLRFRLDWFEITEAAPTTVPAHSVASVLWLSGLLAMMAASRLYDEDTLFSGGGEHSRLFRSVTGAGAVLAAFVFLTQSFYVSRSWFLLLVVLSFGALSLQRMLLRRFLSHQRKAGIGRRAAILVGRVDRWEEWPFEEEHEFNVVARLSPGQFEPFCKNWNHPAASRSGTAVILRARDFNHDEFWRILMMSGTRGWAVFVHSPVRSVGRDRLTVRELGGQAIVKVAPPTLVGVRAVQKRVLDLLASGVLFFVLLPVLVIIAVAVVISSGFPVLYKQERVGLGGQPFQMLKFRTMRVDAEKDSGPVWASTDDPRRTLLGRFLRRLSLDELPQLWNVLRGDMSLVGPRPERPTFTHEFDEQLTWYRFRHRIRPGITGWAQSHGLRGNTSLDSRVQFDNWYIENWSIWLDMKIIVMTVREVVSGRNAY